MSECIKGGLSEERIAEIIQEEDQRDAYLRGGDEIDWNPLSTTRLYSALRVQKNIPRGALVPDAAEGRLSVEESRAILGQLVASYLGTLPQQLEFRVCAIHGEPLEDYAARLERLFTERTGAVPPDWRGTARLLLHEFGTASDLGAVDRVLSGPSSQLRALEIGTGVRQAKLVLDDAIGYPKDLRDTPPELLEEVEAPQLEAVLADPQTLAPIASVGGARVFAAQVERWGMAQSFEIVDGAHSSLDALDGSGDSRAEGFPGSADTAFRDACLAIGTYLKRCSPEVQGVVYSCLVCLGDPLAGLDARVNDQIEKDTLLLWIFIRTGICSSDAADAAKQTQAKRLLQQTTGNRPDRGGPGR